MKIVVLDILKITFNKFWTKSIETSVPIHIKCPPPPKRKSPLQGRFRDLNRQTSNAHKRMEDCISKFSGSQTIR